MRKQTKLVAVLSAAALLAIGASMTSFAAGWQKNDDGSWNYYDSDDEMVTGEWKKDGAKWFYLDDDGVMLTDSWVDDEYYVGDDGAMLINSWKKTLSDDELDDPEDDGENWYYFTSKGKKTVDESKKIGGKTYYFDTATGAMKDGWYEDTSNNFFYLGEEDDGARKSGWLWLGLPDDEDEFSNGCDDDCTICDEEGWYYFDSSGKMYGKSGKKKVNGRSYFFNAHGQMLYEWVNNGQHKPGSNAQLDGQISDASKGEIPADDMVYLNVVEEGWRADGWYEIDGSKATDTADSTEWYYFKDGAAKKADTTTVIAVNDDGDSIYRAKHKIKASNNKNFCFDEKGQMQTGLQAIPDSNGRLEFYYFDDNGYMKTGKIASVEEDGDSFTYYFSTTKGGNGVGFTGDKDGYLYWNGKRLEADDDYELYEVKGDVYLVNTKGKIQKSAKTYDVENNTFRGNDKVEVTFNGKYVEKVNNIDVKTGNVVHADVTRPQIELYDQVISSDNAAFH